MTISTALFLSTCLAMTPAVPRGVCHAEVADGGPYRVAVPIVGVASQYDPGIMSRVVARQQRLGRLPDDLSIFDGFIAVQRCTDVGKFYLLRPLGTERWELFAAADCSGSVETTAWMRRGGILAEVDFATASRWQTIGRGIEIEMVGVP
jgi:hypothetical protein